MERACAQLDWRGPEVMTRVSAPSTSAEIRYFEPESYDAALHWVRA